MAATVQIIDSKQTGPNGFEGYTVRDLKAHLRERGCHVSGTKAELIKRAMGLRVLSERQFSNTDLEQTEDKVEQDSRKQEARFATSLGEKLPEPWTVPSSEWTDSEEDIPIIRWKVNVATMFPLCCMPFLT
ncbi:uncharacterized protein [Haliotis asinina]|uniref:uncharacterized protein isoform X2 n=1 Tax=Haliotis asinina TaxID=109174 RepID=UPI003531E470